MYYLFNLPLIGLCCELVETDQWSVLSGCDQRLGFDS